MDKSNNHTFDSKVSKISGITREKGSGQRSFKSPLIDQSKDNIQRIPEETLKSNNRTLKEKYERLLAENKAIKERHYEMLKDWVAHEIKKVMEKVIDGEE